MRSVLGRTAKKNTCPDTFAGTAPVQSHGQLLSTIQLTVQPVQKSASRRSPLISPRPASWIVSDVNGRSWTEVRLLRLDGSTHAPSCSCVLFFLRRCGPPLLRP